MPAAAIPQVSAGIVTQIGRSDALPVLADLISLLDNFPVPRLIFSG